MKDKNSFLFSRFIFVPVDFLLLLGVFLIAFFFRKQNVVALDSYIIMSLWFVVLYQIVLFFCGSYDVFRYFKISKEIIKILTASFIWILLIASYFFWTRDFFFSRYILLLSLALSIIILSLTRLLYFYLSTYIFPKKKVYILGDDIPCQTLNKYIQKTNQYTTNISKNTFKNKDYDILIITDFHNQKTIEESIEFAIIHHIRVFVYHKDLLRKNVYLDFEGVKMYEIFDTPLHGFERIIKRGVDIILSLLGIVIIAVLFIPLAVVIKTTSKGPIFVGLQRIGRGNKPFTIYKFRSMVVDAANMKEDLLQKNERKGPLFKIKGDPRITPVGSFLRKSRLDEIPQFWNVLQGDMSLVGPRPHEPNEVSKYQSYQKKLLMIKPGLTGRAQVSGASDLDFEEEVELDMAYIENWSLWSDVVIMFKTVWVVLIGRGAE